MAQTKNLGRIIFVNRGTYNVSTQYNALDIVTHDGASWCALRSVKGVSPVSGQYWMALAEKGDKGDQGPMRDDITVDGVSASNGNIPLNAFSYTPTTYTSAQKTQTRQNINAQETLIVDSELSDTSTNLVENRAIKAEVDSDVVILSRKAPDIDITETGDIITVTDAAEKPAKSLSVAMEPIQAGTGDPSPENVRPISGRTGLTVTRTGKNVFGGTAMRDNPLSISSSVTTGTDADGDYVSFPSNAMGGAPVIFDAFKAENTQYTFVIAAKKNNTNKASNLKLVYTNDITVGINLDDSSVVADTLYTVAVASSGSRSLKALAGNYSSGTTKLYYNRSGVFEGVLTTDDFESYVGTTYPVSWQTEAGTVYGGTLDVVSGVLTVDMAFVDTTWGSLTNETTYTGYTIVRRRYNIPTAKKADVESFLAKAICNILPVNSGISSPSQGVHFAVSSSNGSYIYCFMESSTASDTAIQIAWPIATPQIYQLTPTEISMLLGLNNVFSDSGPISLTYACDTKMYIDNKFAALMAIASES